MKDEKNGPIPDQIVPPPAGGPKAPNLNQQPMNSGPRSSTASNPNVNPNIPPAGGPKAPNINQTPPISQSNMGYGQTPPVSQSNAGYGQTPPVSQSSMGYSQQPPVSQSNAGYMQAQQIQIQMQQMQQQMQQMQQQVLIAQSIAAKEKSKAEDFCAMAQRLQSEFDNYRKRTADNNKKLKEDGIVEVIEKLVNILDVFKRAISMITDVNIQDGVKMIYRQLNDVLTSFGVTEIPALGEMFDPELHNAIMTVKVKDKEKSGTIVEILQKGYIMGERVIRHTAVKVAN